MFSPPGSALPAFSVLGIYLLFAPDRFRGDRIPRDTGARGQGILTPRRNPRKFKGNFLPSPQKIDAYPSKFLFLVIAQFFISSYQPLNGFTPPYSINLLEFLILRPLYSFCTPFLNFTHKIYTLFRQYLPQISVFSAPFLGYARG